MENVIPVDPRIGSCVTNREIAYFWRQRRLVEEDHLYAALKAAARIRARNLTYDKYLEFEKSSEEKKDNEIETTISGEKYENQETRLGIKDWWTKSKYAYLNEPAIESSRTRSCNTYLTQLLHCHNSPPAKLSS